MDPQSEQVNPEASKPVIHDDSIQEVVDLARRLRDSLGGDLDDDAIHAVAEATGAPIEYVRLAVQSLPVEKTTTPLERLKSSFLAFDHDLRRYVMAGVLGCVYGILASFSRASSDLKSLAGTLAIFVIFGMVWNSIVARSTKSSSISGAIASSVAFFSVSLFSTLISLLPGVQPSGPSPGFLLLFMPVGFFSGLSAFYVGGWLRKILGLKDPVKERQALLQQLLDIQDKLKSDEKFVTFLSLDIVGSTMIKAENDPIFVEFTFNEYHKYVASVASKFSGRIHSTAGDGVTVAFDDPKNAFAASKAIMAGMFEFNSYKNKTTKPIELRGGLHTGSVLAPGQDVTSVNFAHVIDIAAHMQKAAPNGCLGVSDTTATYIPGGRESVGTEVLETQNVRGVVWRPRSRIEPSRVVS